jgi:lipopolysaccharide exporter
MAALSASAAGRLAAAAVMAALYLRQIQGLLAIGIAAQLANLWKIAVGWRGYGRGRACLARRALRLASFPLWRNSPSLQWQERSFYGAILLAMRRVARDRQWPP